jgi:hypothetical protein
VLPATKIRLDADRVATFPAARIVALRQEGATMSAEALAWFCEHVVELRRRARLHGVAAEVEAMSATALARLDLDLAELRELSRRLGGPEPTVRGGLLPGVDPGEPARVEYRCPADRCARLGRRQPGGPHPVCNLDGAQLKVQVVDP